MSHKCPRRVSKGIGRQLSSDQMAGLGLEDDRGAQYCRICDIGPEILISPAVIVSLVTRPVSILATGRA